MAEGGEDLQQISITCANCQNHCMKSDLLACLHCYCKKCVLKVSLEPATNQPVSCPECHQEVRCEECTESGNRAVAFCHQCDQFICRECVMSHKRMKSYASHEVISLTKVESTPSRCLTHEEPLILYCFDCDHLICHHCTVKTHREHSFEFCKIAAPEKKKLLQNEVKDLKELNCTLSHSVQVIQTTKQDIVAQGDSVASTIHTSFSQLHFILDNRKEELLRQNTDKVEKKIRKLSEQEESLSVAVAEVQTIVDYTDQCVSNCSDNEVMNLHGEIVKRIKRGLKEHNKSTWSLAPEEEVDIGVEVKVEDHLQKLCQTKAKITQLGLDPAHCTVTGEGLELAEVNRTAAVTLTTNLANNKITRRRTMVVSKLRSLYDRSVVKCKVEQSGPGEYRIQFTPTVRGCHELTVSVDGQQIAGSPFYVAVSIPPTSIDKPVMVWSGIPKPTGITVNSVGEVLACTFSGIIMKLEEDGKCTVLVKDTSYHWRDLATDSENHIFCVSLSASILRYDRQTGNHQIKEIQQEERNAGRCGVAVAGDQVMVSDINNTGVIMVYNRNLEYMRCIEHENMGMFAGISLDKHHIYVTDIKKSSIHIFSHGGNFIRSIDGGQRLSKPSGVCVSGLLVFVTEYHSNSVVIFTTSGNYVTSFGQSGEAEGSFQGPSSVCVNKKKFIFVTDHKNCRIQCF